MSLSCTTFEVSTLVFQNCRQSCVPEHTAYIACILFACVLPTNNLQTKSEMSSFTLSKYMTSSQKFRGARQSPFSDGLPSAGWDILWPTKTWKPMQNVENGVFWGHSRSSAMSPFDRVHTTSYSTLTETMCLFYIINNIASSLSRVIDTHLSHLHLVHLLWVTPTFTKMLGNRKLEPLGYCAALLQQACLKRDCDTLFQLQSCQLLHHSTKTHTHTQPFNGLWSATTRVGLYQKKHSPTHTHPDHRTSFIIFLHL